MAVFTDAKGGAIGFYERMGFKLLGPLVEPRETAPMVRLLARRL